MLRPTARGDTEALMTPSSRPSTSRTLAEAFDPRANSLNALRLFFAALVAVGHCALVVFAQRPLKLGSLEMHSLGVDGFFAISGYLITRSWIGRPDLRSFLRRRCARILPGYWVATIFTAFVAGPLIWLGSHHSVHGFSVFGARGAASFVVTNALLWFHQQTLAGAVGHAHQAAAVNGSLWSLFPEFVAYLSVVGLGFAGALKSRGTAAPSLIALFAVLIAWSTWDHASFAAVLHSPILAGNVVRVYAMFAAGMTLCLWERRITMSGRLAGAAAVIVALSAALPQFELLAALPLAYLIMWLGTRLPFTRVGTRRDLSYGLYLYAWPVMQALSWTPVRALGWAGMAVACLAVSAGLALLSWTLVEKPAMAWSRRAARARGRLELRFTRGPRRSNLPEVAVSGPVPERVEA